MNMCRSLIAISRDLKHFSVRGYRATIDTRRSLIGRFALQSMVSLQTRYLGTSPANGRILQRLLGLTHSRLRIERVSAFILTEWSFATARTCTGVRLSVDWVYEHVDMRKVGLLLVAFAADIPSQYRLTSS